MSRGIERRRLRRIRPIPVRNAAGALPAIVSADELQEWLAEEMAELSRISPHRQAHEKESVSNNCLLASYDYLR